MKTNGLLLLLVISGCAPQPVYMLADGTRVPPPAAAEPTGPSGGEVALQVANAFLGGVASGLSEPRRKEQLHTWMHNHAFDIAKCLHTSSTPHAPPADNNAAAELLSENYSSHTSTLKARIYWTGWSFLGGEHSTDVVVTVGGDDAHSTATVAVEGENSNFGVDNSCVYLRGVAMD